jgi:CRISPR/Cas system-associated endonuclease/helicase Cas3
LYRNKYPLYGVDHRANIQKQWDNLDDNIKQFLGSKSELIRIASTYTDDELKFEKNRFLKAMDTIQARADHLALAQKHNLLIEG